MVHGSGPNDRDESIGPNKPFRDIAHGLGRLGIASLRYDKRTYLAGGLKTASSESFDLHMEVLSDVARACDQLDTMPSLSKVFILGHSLGGMLAPKIANENRQVAGIIIMAGNARPLETLIMEQYRYIMEPNGFDEYERDELTKLKKTLQNLELLKANEWHEGLELPIGLSKAYWQSLISYDQTAEIRSVNCSILILQGERDYQVTMEDFQKWKQALQDHEDVDFRSYEKLNHLFMEGEGPSYPSEYRKKGNVASYVINDIGDWIERQN